VPTKLVVYPNEGHLFVKPADAHDYTLRTLEWFDEWFTKASARQTVAHDVDNPH
jgi:dipeptidyl aminopeptidase/acylaminoacyl peptidase